MDGGLRSASQAPDLEPAESEPVDQRFLTSNLDDPTQPQEACSGENTDPAILYDAGHTGTEQIRESESIAGVGLDQDLAFAQGQFLSDSRPSEVHSPSRPRQSVQGEVTGSNGQKIQAPRRSSAGRRHTGKVFSRLPTPGTRRHKHPPFSTVRSQFMVMSVEDTLQFLSWLFEVALSHCVSLSPSINAASAFGCSPNVETEMMYDRDHPNLGADIADVQNSLSTRKHRPWSVEEYRLLVKLREEQGLAWSEVTWHFAQKIPRRSKGSIQVYYA